MESYSKHASPLSLVSASATIRRGHRLLGTLTIITLLAQLFVFAASPARAAVSPAVAAAKDQYGFPDWYQDANGVRLEPCLYTGGVADPNCILLADPSFNPASPLVFPGTPLNFPGEFFYAVADSDKITTPGCPAQGWAPQAAGAFTRVAVEGSFFTGAPISADQITFGRIRIVVKPQGLCPFTTYAFTHPYGTELVTTDSKGGVVANKKGFTEDIGCPGVPCNFSDALASRVLNGFVTWDPAVAPAAPAGYLGDAVTLHPIVGSPNTIFQIADPSTNTILASTNLFTVSGKQAGPLSTQSIVDFGGQAVGTTSAPQTITITNVDTANISVTGLTFTGTNAADFAVAGSTCAAALAQDTTCTVSLTFTPSLLGVESAQLNVAHNGSFRSPITVALTGTGINAGDAPIVTFSTPSLAFGSQRVRTTSLEQKVTLTNTGAAPLGANVALVGANANQFVILGENCTGTFVAAGASCVVGVQFAPTVATALPVTASLSFTDNAAGSPHSVVLSGTGTGGLAAVAATRDQYGFPDWYQDENGVQVQPCLYTNGAADPNCVVLADPTFDPASPLAFPGPPLNFPGEYFYFVADSDKITTPGCPALGWAPRAAGAFTRVAMESSFVTGSPIPGDQISFARIRIVVKPNGLCPDTTYAFTHPYGTELVTTDGDGGVVANKKGFTEDIGCLAAPCDFSLALSSRVFTGFLKWDPSVAPAAPSGYLGDAATLHPVVGSPNNLFKIADATNTTTLASTNLFTVAGKKALPITTSHDVPATDGPIDFGSQMDGTTSAAQTVTITNNDPLNTVTITSASIIGPMLTEYGITANTCASLAPGASCTIGVTFTPALAVLGTRAAALSVAHSGLNSPVQVPLTGTSIGPIATMSTNNLGFGNQGLNVSSAPLTVTLSNTGTGPLMVASLAITPNFSVSATTCLFAPNTLASGASCTISIRFTPSVLGLRTGTLTVQSNAINGPQTVALSGTGIGVPVAPTGLTATAGNAQVSLTWNASVNATGYNVYRGTKKGGPYTKITPAPVTSTSFVSTGLANGTPYFFVVRAVNAVGEGLASAEATATPVAPPTAPTGLIATAGNAQVSLTWNAATGAATYNVKRSTTSGSGYQTIATGLTVRSFTDTGRTNGTTYFYVVTAVNAGGESGNSAQASATPAPQPPAAPTNLTATAGARGTLRIALSWTASAGATSYTIRRGTTRNGPYNTVVATGVTTTSFTNTGLINGTNYFYVVIAVNANGSSGNSNEATARAQ